jgi:hypothetical protein
MAKKTTAVAKTTNTTDLALPLDKAGVTKMIDTFKAKLAELKKEAPEAISLDINYTFGSGSSVNIKNVTKLGELLEISASINARSNAYAVEVKRYGLEGKIKPFTVSDKTAEEWIEIINKAKTELINKTEIEKIEKAIKDLSEFEDEQTKFQRKITGIVESATELLS